MSETHPPHHAATVFIVQDMLDFVEQHLLEPLSPQVVAEQFYLSVSAATNLFKMTCDIAMMTYIRNRRLTLAGEALLTSQTRIIDIALKYGYETPEAFTKAFTRFHDIPPSMVRRISPTLQRYEALKVDIRLQGGWTNGALPSSNAPEQDTRPLPGYAIDIPKVKGGMTMATRKPTHTLRLQDMTYQSDWRILLTLAKALDEAGILFKVDGKTMIFAHGIEFKLEKICLTFKWHEVQRILDFFAIKSAPQTVPQHPGFVFFDAQYSGMKIRCMFYGDCPGDETDDFLLQNTDAIAVDGQVLIVQSLAFWLANTTQTGDPLYALVEAHVAKA